MNFISYFIYCFFIVLVSASSAKSLEMTTPFNVKGQLHVNGSNEYVLYTASGDYVQGQLLGAGMQLVLLDHQGKQVRVLSKGQRDVEEFMFVAGRVGPYRLSVKALKAGNYQLNILQQIPVGAQVGMAELPESPRLRALLKGGGNIEAFWRELEQTGTPMVEYNNVMPPLGENERLVTFLWRGAKRSVRLFGGPSADHEELQRLVGTDIWYRSYRLPETSLLAYRLAPDVPDLDSPPHIRRRAILATAQRDPLNPKSVPDKPLDDYDGYSLFELTAAPVAKWNTAQRNVASGFLETHRFTSHILDNTRDIYLYRPANWQPGMENNALVVVFDGEIYIREVPAPIILDNLIASGRLPSTAAIFISNPSNETRSRELPPNDNFARFLANELIPWAKEQGIYASAARTVVAGASYGGLAAAWAGFKHPEIFGNVYSQSGSFWWAPGWETADNYTRPAEWLTQCFSVVPRLPLRFHLEAGLFELGRDGQSGIRDTTRHLRDVLRARDYVVSHREYAAAHGYEHWRVSFAEGILALIGTDTTSSNTPRPSAHWPMSESPDQE